VIAGGEVTYTITLTNAGPGAASNVTVTDGLPAQSTFVSFSAPAGFTVTTPPVGSSGTVMASTPSFAEGTAMFTLVVRFNPNLGNGAMIFNTVSLSTVSDSTPGNNSHTEQTAVVTSADLSVTKTDSPDPVVAGTNLTYTLTVANAGPSNSQNASLMDPLPANTTFVSAAQTSGPAFTLFTPPPGGTGTFSASIAPFPTGETATFTLVVAVDPDAPAGVPIGNTATINSVVTTDPELADNSATEATAVTAEADLAVTKTDSPDPVAAGGELTFLLTVTNDGTSDAQDVTLTDPLPPGTTFVSAEQTAGPTFTLATPPVGGTGTFSATVASFPAGATATFSLVVEVAAATPDATVLSNTATVASTTTDPVPADNGDTETTSVTGAPAPEEIIPTLSETMLLLLAAMLAVAGLMAIRAR
jgi:uncharacterized repeat protein (TIGR01451 family)